MKKMMMVAGVVLGLSVAGTAQADHKGEEVPHNIPSILMDERLGYTAAPYSEGDKNRMQFYAAIDSWEETHDKQITFDELFYFQRNYIMQGERIH